MKYMKREGILPNFEKMEIVLIADFHYYNLLFCKEDLMLSNRKTAILLNIFWELLSHNNPGYSKSKDTSAHLNLSSSDNNNLLEKKTLDSDVETFKMLLYNHSCGQTEEKLKEMNITQDVAQMKVFEISQIKQIIEYIFGAYIDKFNLYKYVFENKKKNEEVRETHQGPAARYCQ